ncbi:phosphohydrolase [Nonlabens spongiae]|uniref:Phosphohydrolase n=1 Tax=Nonlabens spongiae TaxID=331648 RepID=A0A1W6MGC7_9FLAO|nr:HDIG domain-containing metalloprotein [Nonlabens spongiae]ARN76630.1 phosphohydrolase [Nonlabens spongiae]
MLSFLKDNQITTQWIARISLLIFCTAFVIYFFPKSNRFTYEFEQGQPWEYETLYAPFSFPIKKSDEEIKKAQKEIKQSTPRYFKKDKELSKLVKNEWSSRIEQLIIDSIIPNNSGVGRNGISLLESIYKNGFLENPLALEDSHPVYIDDGNEVVTATYGGLILPAELNKKLNRAFNTQPDSIQPILKRQLLGIIRGDIIYNEELTELNIEDELENIIPTKGLVSRNARIIAQGEIVEGDKLQKLKTLNDLYQAQTWTESQYGWKLLGYFILVAMAMIMLLLFIHKYRYQIYLDFRKLAFVYFNVLFFILLTSMVVKFQDDYLYIVPVCMLPLIIKAFFDSRLGLFTHVITIFVLSFIVPNSAQYLFLQMMAGIVTILSGSEIYKRANLFITVGQILLVYLVSYTAFYAINQGGILGWDWTQVAYFGLSSLALLFVWPLIYVYERIFGLVSDVSLLELSDTNSKLLKKLADKAPGTFHHSLNVANIAETVANEVGANAMLVRVGALYHDIGKMKNPTYFVENQTSGVNPHDDMDPEESAQIIVNHVIDGIEIARKNNLPDRIIDFIRTHHGDSTVYYFYKQAKEQDPEVPKKLFQYKGPRPFSLETAILMISDSVEAASKSLPKPTAILINNLVDNIVSKQVSNDQFLNADITFKQIETIKAVVKKKLASIYHLRIEYPE